MKNATIEVSGTPLAAHASHSARSTNSTTRRTVHMFGAIALGYMAVLSGGIASAQEVTNKVVLGQSSHSKPALTYYYGKWYMAYQGADNQLHLTYSDDDGVTFPASHDRNLGEYTWNGPALAVYGPYLYLAWTQTDKRLVVAQSSTVPPSFTKQVLWETSDNGPALATAGGVLYLAWTGTGTPYLNVSASRDGGRTFPNANKVTLSDCSYHQPALAVSDSAFSSGARLFLGWTAPDHSLHLLSSFLNPGAPYFTYRVNLNDTSDAGPSLAFATDYNHDYRLYITWAGVGNLALNTNYSSSGLSASTFNHKAVFWYDQSWFAPVIYSMTEWKFNQLVYPRYIAFTGTDYHLNFGRIN